MCNKTKFITKAVARQRMSEIQSEKRKREKTPLRIYECPDCGFFHMTSRPMREFSDIQFDNQNDIESITDEPRTKTKSYLHRSRPRYTEGYARRQY